MGCKHRVITHGNCDLSHPEGTGLEHRAKGKRGLTAFAPRWCFLGPIGGVIVHGRAEPLVGPEDIEQID